MGEALPSGRRTHLGFVHISWKKKKKLFPFLHHKKNLLNVNDERAERETFFFLGTRPTSSLLQVDVYREITHTLYYSTTTVLLLVGIAPGEEEKQVHVCVVCKRRKVGLARTRRKKKPPGVAQQKTKQVQVLFQLSLCPASKFR